MNAKNGSDTKNDIFGAKRQLLSKTLKANGSSIDVATASQSENVLATINLNTREGIYGDWSFEQEIGSPIDQENNDGDKSNLVIIKW